MEHMEGGDSLNPKSFDGPTLLQFTKHPNVLFSGRIEVFRSTASGHQIVWFLGAVGWYSLQGSCRGMASGPPEWTHLCSRAVVPNLGQPKCPWTATSKSWWWWPLGIAAQKHLGYPWLGTTGLERPGDYSTMPWSYTNVCGLFLRRTQIIICF